MNEHCDNCKYWLDQGNVGECHRYPNPTMKFKKNWCGEYWAKVEKPKLDTQPVKVTVEKPAQTFPAIEIIGEVAGIVAPAPKKRGRPKKIV